MLGVRTPLHKVDFGTLNDIKDKMGKKKGNKDNENLSKKINRSLYKVITFHLLILSYTIMKIIIN